MNCPKIRNQFTPRIVPPFELLSSKNHIISSKVYTIFHIEFESKKTPSPYGEERFALALGAPKSTAGGTCVAEEDERIAKGEHSDPKDAQAFFGERPYIKTL